MKWVNFLAWTDFHSPLSWILAAYIRVDASSTQKTPIKYRKTKNSFQTYESQVHGSTIYEKTNLVSFVHLKRSFLSTGWTNLFKRKKKRIKLSRNATLLFTSQSRFRCLRWHITNNEVFFKRTFPHDCLLTFDCLLSAHVCLWKKRKVSLHPYGRTICNLTL